MWYKLLYSMSNGSIRKKSSGFLQVGDILNHFDPLQDKYISREFQKYGYDLAQDFNDVEHKSLYIKMAKELPRILLEKARSYVKDATHAKSKPRLFMWKVSQLRKELKDKQT